MESIVNIEDRLRLIKSIFELSIEAKVFPEDILIYTIHQQWPASNNFRSEILNLNLNDPRYQKTIDIIYGLTVEIMNLFDKARNFIGEIKQEYTYHIECKPLGLSSGPLFLIRKSVPEYIKGKTYSDEQIKEYEKRYYFCENDWYIYTGISNEENSDFVFTNPLFLLIFVETIRCFLEDRIKINDSEISLKFPQEDSKNSPTIKHPRRVVAFCVGLLCQEKKYNVADMTKKKLQRFIEENFKEVNSGAVTRRLLGYDDTNDLALLVYDTYSDSGRDESRWVFEEAQFKIMTEQYPEDFKCAKEMFRRFS